MKQRYLTYIMLAFALFLTLVTGHAQAQQGQNQSSGEILTVMVEGKELRIPVPKGMCYLEPKKHAYDKTFYKIAPLSDFINKDAIIRFYDCKSVHINRSVYRTPDYLKKMIPTSNFLGIYHDKKINLISKKDYIQYIATHFKDEEKVIKSISQKYIEDEKKIAKKISDIVKIEPSARHSLKRSITEKNRNFITISEAIKLKDRALYPTPPFFKESASFTVVKNIPLYFYKYFNNPPHFKKYQPKEIDISNKYIQDFIDLNP
ncbi:MAG: hypothetical protein ACTSXQ_06375 [Alphaproteobacteria bacterium]